MNENVQAKDPVGREKIGVPVLTKKDLLKLQPLEWTPEHHVASSQPVQYPQEFCVPPPRLPREWRRPSGADSFVAHPLRQESWEQMALVLYCKTNPIDLPLERSP